MVGWSYHYTHHNQLRWIVEISRLVSCFESNFFFLFLCLLQFQDLMPKLNEANEVEIFQITRMYLFLHQIECVIYRFEYIHATDIKLMLACSFETSAKLKPEHKKNTKRLLCDLPVCEHGEIKLHAFLLWDKSEKKVSNSGGKRIIINFFHLVVWLAWLQKVFDYFLFLFSNEKNSKCAGFAENVKRLECCSIVESNIKREIEWPHISKRFIVIEMSFIPPKRRHIRSGERHADICSPCVNTTTHK